MAPVSMVMEMNKWLPYYFENRVTIRMLVPCPDTDFDVTGIGISNSVTENDMMYGRALTIGICRDMALQSPYDDNTTCVPVFTESYGNTQMNVRIRNYNSGFRGYHKYTLGFYTNYVFEPRGLKFAGAGAAPGLCGTITG